MHIKCLVLSWRPESCQFSHIKSSILFINHWSCVFRSTFVYLQPLFATYALKWKDYHLTLISIRYLGCFVPVLCHFAVWENPTRLSSIENHQAGTPTQARQTRTPFLVAEGSPTSRAKASRVKQQLLHVCHCECKNPAHQVPTNGRTSGRAFQGTIPEWGMYKRSHPSSNWPSCRAQSKRGGKRNKFRRILFGR